MLQSKILKNSQNAQVGVVIFDPVKAFIFNKWEALHYTNFAPPPQLLKIMPTERCRKGKGGKNTDFCGLG